MAATDDGCVQLDVSQSEGQVWLLKVPAIVDQAWKNSAGRQSDSSLAKVICTFDPLNPDPQSAMEFTMELATGGEGADIKSYGLNLQKDVVPTHIFSDAQGKLAIEGKVERKFDLIPNNTVQEEYRQLCRERDKKFNTKTRKIQLIDDHAGNLMRPMPTTSTIPLPSKDPKKRASAPPKGNEGKRTRISKADLEDMVFKLFERQSNWALKQLLQETDQPVAFLKEILNELCTYNKRGTNQGTYELKPEYRKNGVEEEKPATS